MAHHGCNILWVVSQVYPRARLPADNIRESYTLFFYIHVIVFLVPARERISIYIRNSQDCDNATWKHSAINTLHKQHNSVMIHDLQVVIIPLVIVLLLQTYDEINKTILRLFRIFQRWSLVSVVSKPSLNPNKTNTVCYLIQMHQHVNGKKQLFV